MAAKVKKTKKAAVVAVDSEADMIAKAREQYPGLLLLFLRGDYYEAYGEDAGTLAKVIGVKLMIRNGIPMTFFPGSMINQCLRKLLVAGVRVAICEHVK